MINRDFTVTADMINDTDKLLGGLVQMQNVVEVSNDVLNYLNINKSEWSSFKNDINQMYSRIYDISQTVTDNPSEWRLVTPSLNCLEEHLRYGCTAIWEHRKVKLVKKYVTREYSSDNDYIEKIHYEDGIIYCAAGSINADAIISSLIIKNIELPYLRRARNVYYYDSKSVRICNQDGVSYTGFLFYNFIDSDDKAFLYEDKYIGILVIRDIMLNRNTDVYNGPYDIAETACGNLYLKYDGDTDVELIEIETRKEKK